jgi:hypothetical protein
MKGRAATEKVRSSTEKGKKIVRSEVKKIGQGEN